MNQDHQYKLLPGISLAKARFLAEQRWNRPLRAVFPQNPATCALFGLGARKQLDLYQYNDIIDKREEL